MTTTPQETPPAHEAEQQTENTNGIGRQLLRVYPWAFLGVIVMLILFHAFYTLTFPKLIPAPGKDVTVARGESIRTIAVALTQDDVVNSSLYLSVYMRLRGMQAKPGTYHFEGNISILDVADSLSHGGKTATIVVTEGMTVKDVERLLARQNISANLSQFTLKDFPNIEFPDAFANAPLEGFLFPDTYKFYGDENDKTIAAKLLQNFKLKALPRLALAPDPYQALITASILEKEVKALDEKRIVAGILEKRLANNALLQIDATLVYAKCKGLYVFCENRTLTAKDKVMNSPYNSYKVTGLPPAPIGNPGLDSIEAALNPTATAYYYYFTTPDGTAVFSTTLEKHQAGLQKYYSQ